MKKKYWVVLILSLIAIAVLVIYANQPYFPLAPIVTPHNKLPHPHFAATTPPSATMATSSPVQVDTSGWKTYINSQYGFQFQYPAADSFSTASDGVSLLPPGALDGIGFSFYSFSDFSSDLTDGSFDETLKYDQAKQQWQIILGLNETLADSICPSENKTRRQQLPYYQIGDLRTGRDWDFAYVTKNGIIVLDTPDWFLPNRLDATQSYQIDPSAITFTNPQDVLSVACSTK